MRRDPPRLDAWQPWRPAELAARLAGCAVPWYVLDLHHPGHDRRGRINDVPGRYA